MGQDHLDADGNHVKAKAPATCVLMMRGLKSFFESQELELKFRSRDTPRGMPNGQRIILSEQIRDLYDAAARGLEYKRRNRALIMFQKDSGIRIGDTCKLDVGDYREALVSFNDAGEKFIYIDPRRTEKAKIIAHIHLGPESIDCIDSYLTEREEGGEVLSADKPLFLKGVYMGRPRKQMILPGDEHRLTSIAITAIFIRLTAHLGKKGKKTSAHSFRKFQQTMCETTMAKNYVAKLQGKKIMDSTGPYSKPEDIPGELMQYYMAGYDRLRIFGEKVSVKTINEQTERIKALEKKNDALEERLDRSTWELDKRERDFSDLEAQVKNVLPGMQAQLNELSKQMNAENEEEDPSSFEYKLDQLLEELKRLKVDESVKKLGENFAEKFMENRQP
jgi:integrase